MAKMWVEVCLISARHLRHSSSLWKLQWYAVGWIYPKNKYCTEIDAPGHGSPVWETKFSTLVDSSESNFQDLALHVEVYSREPIFLAERLQGRATILLKEFQEKYLKKSNIPNEEVGSFQLRKKNSNKPQGFVDLSIRISEEREQPSPYVEVEREIGITDHGNGIALDSEYGQQPAYTTRSPKTPTRLPENDPQATSQYGNLGPFPGNHIKPEVSGPSYASGGPHFGLSGGPHFGLSGGTSHEPPRTPPSPPPPPSNVGYIPTLLPRIDNMQPSYINMPSSGPAPKHYGGPDSGMGVDAGALAVGAVIFGDDFMSGFDVRCGLLDASLTISTDPLF